MIGRKDWRTPPAFFRQEWEKYRFTVDAAADDDNALVRPCQYLALAPKPVGTWDACCDHAVGRYYTAETNGLNPEHYAQGDRVWSNPPYDASLLKWLALASETRLRGVFWELLLQPATDTRWWHRYVWDGRLGRPREGVELEFLPYRTHFIDPDAPEKDSPRGANVLVRFWPEGFQL